MEYEAPPTQRDPDIEDYMALVRSVAARYRRPGIDMDDLLQEGVIGLLEARKRYQSAKGSFGVYSSFWVEKMIRASCRRDTTVLTSEPAADEAEDGPSLPAAGAVPARLPACLTPVEREVIDRSLNRGETLAGIAAACGIPPAHVKQVKARALRKMRAGRTAAAREEGRP